MIAYNHTSLDNLLINEEAAVALHHNLISKEEAAAIEQTYAVNLYSPNIFIRIGLFLLTAIIILLGFGLFCLLLLSGTETTFGVLALVTSLGIYGALEFLISDKNHFGSGIDDAMIWLSAGFMVTAVNLLFDPVSFLGQSILVFMLAAYFLLRFSNVLMGGVAFIAFLSIVFTGAIELGNVAKTAMPFLLMGLSFLVYWLVRKYKNETRLRHYKACCSFVEILALLTLYIAGNYFAVREVSNSMFNLYLKEGESITAGWFFWIWTILIPLTYIFKGIQKRDAILLRTGLVLVAAIVFTVRYYHSVAPIEIAMSVGGLIMILLAYGITKYLTPSKHGFTHAEPNDPQITGLLQVESLVVAQTFHQTTPAQPEKHFEFGEGSTGGGGSTGSF